MILNNHNYKCIFIVNTNAYDININNLDIRLVVQWDILTKVDVMIQRLRSASSDSNQSIFILIILKKTNIKDLKKLEQCQNRSIFQLFNNNRPKVHLLSQFINTSSISNRKFIVKSKAKFDNKNINKTNLFFILLAIEKET